MCCLCALKEKTIYTYIFLSADLLPEKESSGDELVCLCVGNMDVYIRACLRWMFECEKYDRHVGVTALRPKGSQKGQIYAIDKSCVHTKHNF